MDATLMSQSFTIKDATRTDLKEERINLEIDEQIEYERQKAIEDAQQELDEYDEDKDAYPEPDGDPSY